MNTTNEIEITGKNVFFVGELLCVVLDDDRVICVPCALFPRLQEATPEQRQNWEFNGPRTAIYWPEVDEDIRIATLLKPKIRIPEKLATAKPFQIEEELKSRLAEIQKSR